MQMRPNGHAAVLRAALALTVAAVVAAPSASGDSTLRRCGTGGTYADAGGGWLELHPGFTVGPANVNITATAPFRPDLIYATNGTQVMRTENGGCDWRVVLDAGTLAGLPVRSPLPGSITALAAPSSATATKRVYVAARVEVPDSPLGRPVVYVSSDRGQPGTWSSSDTAVDGTPRASTLPPSGVITALSACNLYADTAYAVVDATPDGPSTASLYETTDGGATWQRRTSLVTTFAPTRLVVNPVIPSRVYAVVGGQLLLSDDSGQVMRQVGPGGTSVSDVASAVGSSYVRVAQSRLDGGQVDVSTDGGVTWATRPGGLRRAKISIAPLSETVALQNEASVVLLRGSARRDVTPVGGPSGEITLSAPTVTGFAVTGLRRGAVMRLVVGLDKLTPVILVHPVTLLPARATHYFPPLMLPASTVVTLPAGATTDVTFDLLVPRGPSPVDIMFLVDTTGSMQTTIDGLRADLASIVSELATLGLDVQFGLGDYKDVPSPYGGGATDDYPYRLRRPIGPPDASLAAALNQLSASGGNDTPESDLVALYQSTTGEGQRVKGKVLVPSDSDPDYRPDSLHLAVNATDAKFHTGTNYPGFELTGRVLTKHRVHQVGIAVGDGGIVDLQEMARLTDAVAPEGGLDCDGDGTLDLSEGDPLVCHASGISAGAAGTSAGNLRLATAVVALAESATDIRTLSAAASGAPGRIDVVDFPSRPINLKADNEYQVTVRFTCPRAFVPSTSAAVIGAWAGHHQLPQATAALRCAALGAGALPDELLPFEAVVAHPAIAAAPQPPPQQPVPNPNPNPQPNFNPGANANAAVADQEQDVAQLALAGEGRLDTESADEPALEMSALRTQPPPAFLGAVGLLLAVAGCVAIRQRRAVGICTEGNGST
jgi:hypothetical protein